MHLELACPEEVNTSQGWSQIRHPQRAGEQGWIRVFERSLAGCIVCMELVFSEDKPSSRTNGVLSKLMTSVDAIWANFVFLPDCESGVSR